MNDDVRESVIGVLADEHDFAKEPLQTASDEDLSKIARAAGVERDDVLGPDATIGDVADELGERFLTAEDLIDSRIDELDVGDLVDATGSGTAPDDRLEAYGTGLDEHGEESLQAKRERVPEAEQRRQEAIAAERAEAAEEADVGTGVQANALGDPTGGHATERRRVLQAAADVCEDIDDFAHAFGKDAGGARELIATYGVEPGFDEDPDDYGTGVAEGD